MRRGITLLEVLIAMVLLSVGLLAALETISRCAFATRREQDHSHAMIFARSKLEEILKEPVLQTGSDQGIGVDESTDYDWTALIEPTANPSLVLITVAAQNRITGVTADVSVLR